jgi:hypothetical protein
MVLVRILMSKSGGFEDEVLIKLIVGVVKHVVEHVLLLSCVVAYGVRCSIAGGRRERDFLLFPPF